MKANALLFTTACLACGTSIAERLPLWEVGIGAYGLSLPDYRGSEDRQLYALPFPYLQYRGEILRWDRDGGRLRMLNSERTRLDLSLGASPPSETEDSGPRQGMPDLDPTVELGLQLEVLLHQSADARHSWSVALPLRKVEAIQSNRLQSLGWVFTPYVQYERRGVWKTTVSVGPLFASEPYHDYFYQVDPAYASAGRPAYDAEAGYSGSRVTVGVSRRIGAYWIGAFARYDHLGGASFVDSPLVETEHSFMLGAGVAWIFAQSERAAARSGEPW